MDVADRAHLREEEIRSDLLARARRAIGTGISLLNCAECADEIPEERRRAVPGCQLCVHCQNDRERRDRSR